jgi:hypothetical protein
MSREPVPHASGSTYRPFQLLALLGLALAFLAVTVASAQADPTYGTINAEGGIYWRSGPDWNTAEAIGGFGFYPDTIIEVHCYQSGAGDVPGSTDSMWEEASDVGGSGYGSGWINEHFINDGQPINQPSPGVPPCGAAPAPAPTPSPAPAPTPTGGLVFTVFNAEGGIYYRYGPHWSETTQTPGIGVYDGDQVELICGAFGDAVGPYADTAWSLVRNLSRPVGEGWVNEHFIDDGAPDNGFVAGEPICQPGSSGGSGGGGAAGGGSSSTSADPPTSVFYSPNGNPEGVSVPEIASTDLASSKWSTGDACSDSKVLSVTPNGTATLAGWSDARMGPIYFLEAANTQRRAQVHTIILFDPGDSGDFEKASLAKTVWDKIHGVDPTSCDWQYPINSLLANWLSSNHANRLIVMTGSASEEPNAGKSTYAGLWHYYFADIWNKPFAKQAQVCDYAGMGHPEVLEKFSGIVKSTPAGCPPSPSHAHPLTAWNP